MDVDDATSPTTKLSPMFFPMEAAVWSTDGKTFLDPTIGWRQKEICAWKSDWPPQVPRWAFVMICGFAYDPLISCSPE